MTVGISLTQEKGLEAIVVADSRASQMGRQSDSANKIGEFSSDNYHGVIFGSGNGNLIVGLITNLDNVKGDNLDSFVTEVHRSYKSRIEKSDQEYLDSAKKEIRRRASLLLDENPKEAIEKMALAYPEQEREGFIRHKLAEAQKKYDDFVEQQIHSVMESHSRYKNDVPTSFILVAYDKDNNKLRQFSISESGYSEAFVSHIEIGSGMDGANMYLAANLQGITSNTKLNTSDLLFYALNAYASSSMNPGVGGVPKVVKVGKEKNTHFSDEQITALVNLSDAFLSRFSEEKLTREKTKQYISDILENKEKVYETVADVIGLTVDGLKTMATPYSVWQERSNKHFFNGKN